MFWDIYVVQLVTVALSVCVFLLVNRYADEYYQSSISNLTGGIIIGILPFVGFLVPTSAIFMLFHMLLANEKVPFKK